MANETEPAKLLLPYLQRADELQKHEPLVAYYCRLYAMERGLKIPSSGRTKTTNDILLLLMKQLEKDKKSLKLGPEDSLYLEGFASSVFAKADKQDRAGRADLNTAKTFYAASIFFEILSQFGETQPDLEQKQKYAAWKAADIRKALKEGRKPEPGPPGDDDDDLSLLSSTTSGAYDIDSSKTYPTTDPRQSHPSPRVHDDVNCQNYTETSPSSSKSNNNYPSQDFHQPPPHNKSESSSYTQPGYHHETHPQEPPNHFPQELHHFPLAPQQHFPQDPPQHFPQDPSQHFPQEPQRHFPKDHEHQFSQNYSFHETSSPSNSLPNFQSYPSFSDSSLPAAPAHYPSFYQGSGDSYTSQSAPPPTNYASPPQYNQTHSMNSTVSEPAPACAPKFEYDCNYMPPPEKIAEAHKAARFAVGALAFDDVSIAVDFLQKSLELLTNPAAGGH